MAGTGQQLLVTTFNNANTDNADHPQAYPGPFPDASNPARTEATENNTLGYNQYAFGGVPGVYDSIYRIEKSFSHTDPNLSLVFSGKDMNTDGNGIDDEAWGIDNLVITGE